MRIRQLIVVVAVLATALAVAPAANALSRQSADGPAAPAPKATPVPSPTTTAPPTTIPPTTTAPSSALVLNGVDLNNVASVEWNPNGPTLNGYYNGTLSADNAPDGSPTSATLGFGVTGNQGALSADVVIGTGAHVDCHGDNQIPYTDISMTGSNVGSAPDGGSLFDLTGTFGFDVSVHVNATVTITDAELSPDGQTFSGTAHVQLDPDYVSGCTKDWSFTTTLHVDTNPKVTVPSVLGESSKDAKTQLEAVGLTVHTTSQPDCFPDFPGEVIDQTPSPGTVVDQGSSISLTVETQAPKKSSFCTM
jgi:PASTA domain